MHVREREILSDSLGCNDSELLICSDLAVFLVPFYLENQDKCQHFTHDVIRTYISVESHSISLFPSSTHVPTVECITCHVQAIHFNTVCSHFKMVMLTCPKCVSDCFICKTSTTTDTFQCFTLNHMQKYEKIRYDLTDSNFFFTLTLPTTYLAII